MNEEAIRESIKDCYTYLTDLKKKHLNGELTKKEFESKEDGVRDTISSLVSLLYNDNEE